MRYSKKVEEQLSFAVVGLNSVPEMVYRQVPAGAAFAFLENGPAGTTMVGAILSTIVTIICFRGVLSA